MTLEEDIIAPTNQHINLVKVIATSVSGDDALFKGVKVEGCYVPAGKTADMLIIICKAIG